MLSQSDTAPLLIGEVTLRLRRAPKDPAISHLSALCSPLRLLCPGLPFDLHVSMGTEQVPPKHSGPWLSAGFTIVSGTFVSKVKQIRRTESFASLRSVKRLRAQPRRALPCA